jgi:alanine racemase
LVIVSMDLIAVDISDVPDAQAGDSVELLGPTALLDDAARAAGTVAHECLVRLSPRAERVYLGDAQN